MNWFNITTARTIISIKTTFGILNSPAPTHIAKKTIAVNTSRLPAKVSTNINLSDSGAIYSDVILIVCSKHFNKGC